MKCLITECLGVGEKMTETDKLEPIIQKDKSKLSWNNATCFIISL